MELQTIVDFASDFIQLRNKEVLIELMNVYVKVIVIRISLTT